MVQAEIRELKRILHPRPLFRCLLCATSYILPHNTVGSTTRCKIFRLKYYVINKIDRGGNRLSC